MKKMCSFKTVVSIIAFIAMIISVPVFAAQTGGDGDTSGYVSTTPSFNWGNAENGGSADGMFWGSYDITDTESGIVKGDAYVQGFAFGESKIGDTYTSNDRTFTENWSAGTLQLEGYANRLDGDSGTLELGGCGSLKNQSQIGAYEGSASAMHETSINNILFEGTGESLEGHVNVFGHTAASQYEDANFQARQASFTTGLESSGTVLGDVYGQACTNAYKEVSGIASYSSTDTSISSGISSGQYVSGYGYSSAFSERSVDGAFGWAYAISGTEKGSLAE